MVAVVVAAGAKPLGAQDAPPPMHGWVSVGLGAATQQSLAANIGGVITSGQTAYAVQWSEASGVFGGNDRKDLALLIGRRTSDPNVFVVGGVGPAWARISPNCYESPCDQRVHRTAAAAMFGQAVVATPLLGFSLGTFGVLGPKNVSYVGAVFSLCLGWFGD